MHLGSLEISTEGYGVMRFAGSLIICVIAWGVVVMWGLRGFSSDGTANVMVGAFSAIWILVNTGVLLYDLVFVLRAYYKKTYHLVGKSVVDHQVSVKHVEIFLAPNIVLGFAEALISLVYFRESSGRSHL